MKKSNKIIIGFLILLPVMMGLFNLLLGTQYAQGNLQRRYGETPRDVTRELKPFRHLVLNGQVVSHFNTARYGLDVKRFELEIAPHLKPQLSLDSRVTQFVQERYNGDTLFIWYEVKRLRNRMDFSSYDYRNIKVSAPSLTSLTVRKAILEARNIVQQEPLKIMAESVRNLAFTKMELPVLTVYNQKSYVNFSQFMKVDSLWIEAQGPASYYFNTPDLFGKVVLGGVDSLTNVSISGRPANIQAYLNEK